MTFTTDEVAAIKRFIAWTEERYLGGNEGITSADDDGITITEFDAVSDYDSYTLDKSAQNLPWVALLDPEEYDRQCKAAEEREKREWEARGLAQVAAREAEEREQLRRLSIKYGPAIATAAHRGEVRQSGGVAASPERRHHD